MSDYKYTPLNEKFEEIRLITLLPGEFHDDIRINIINAPFSIPKSRPAQRISQEELQNTVSSEWKVFLTLDGRYLFSHREAELSHGRVGPIWEELN